MAISNWRGAKMRSTGTWMARVSRDERLMAAELTIYAYTGCEDDLIRMAISIDLEVPWGESLASLRARIIWRGRWWYRLKVPFAAPEPVLTWWARAVHELPPSLQPPVRRLIDRMRAKARAREP